MATGSLFGVYSEDSFLLRLGGEAYLEARALLQEALSQPDMDRTRKLIRSVRGLQQEALSQPDKDRTRKLIR